MNNVVLGTFFGTRLNLNGDQGNILALKRYLEAAGLSVEVNSLHSTADAQAANFVMLGHGSMAAMESIHQALESVDFASVMATTPGMAVGSGFEWLTANVLNRQIQQQAERTSEFQVAELGPMSTLGYRNTQTDLPNLQLNQQFICTMLHGPVLAKNPMLLHRAAKAAAGSAGVELSVTPQLRDWVATLNRICGQIWALEAPDQTFQPLVLG